MMKRAFGGQMDGPGAPALIVTALVVLTIAIVWSLDYAGYTPCELCLVERKPFYAGVPLGLATVLAVLVARWRLAAAGYGLLALLFLASAILAGYHAGVEWLWWSGPTGCSGAVQAAPKVGDFLKQLDTVKVVRCDAAALRVFGLSLAGWNVPLSLLLCGLSAWGLWASAKAGGRVGRPR